MLKLTILFVFLLVCGGEGCLRRAAHHSPRTPAELATVLRGLLGGETIHLLPIEYLGEFTLPIRSPIYLKGATDPTTGKGTTLKGNGSGPVLTIAGGRWNLESLALNGSSGTGIQVNGNGHILKAIKIQGIPEAIKIMGNGNILQSISIKECDTGITLNGNSSSLSAISITDAKTYGLKVESGSQGTMLSSVAIITSPVSLILSEKTCCGHVESLGADGVVSILGDKWTFNSIASKGALNIVGCGNILNKSSLKELFLSRTCANDVDGASNSIRRLLSVPSAAVEVAKSSLPETPSTNSTAGTSSEGAVGLTGNSTEGGIGNAILSVPATVANGAKSVLNAGAGAVGLV